MWLRRLVIIGLFGLTPIANAQSLDDDPRAASPRAPENIDVLAERFFDGFRRLGPPGRTTLARFGDYVFTQQVAPGVCYGFAAFSEDITDLDLRLYLGEEEVAQDVGLDGFPLVRWCAVRSGTLRVLIRAFDGAGDVDYQVFVDRDSQAAASGAFDQLTNRLTFAAGTAAPRFVPVSTQWRSLFSGPGIQELDLQVEPGACYAILAAADPGVTELDMALWSDGQQVSADLREGPHPVLAWCPTAPALAQVRVAVIEGRGLVAVQSYRHPTPLR